jgi:hypothetical protein
MEGDDLMQASGFFDSIDDDRLYSSDDFSHFYGLFFTDGVLSLPENALLCAPVEDEMAVTVQPGNALVKAHYFRLDSETTVQIGAASPDYPRIDLITLRFDNSTPARSITLGVKAGTPAGTPHAPELERTDEAYEIAIAVIGIEAAGTSIASFRDTRQDENYCGLVKAKFAIDGVPQPETGVIPHGVIIPVMRGNRGTSGISGTYSTISENEEAHV